MQCAHTFQQRRVAGRHLEKVDLWAEPCLRRLVCEEPPLLLQPQEVASSSRIVPSQDLRAKGFEGGPDRGSEAIGAESLQELETNHAFVCSYVQNGHGRWGVAFTMRMLT